MCLVSGWLPFEKHSLKSLQTSEREIKVTKVATEGEEYPSGRYKHAAACLDYEGSSPRLLVTGGRDDYNPLSDVWLLDVQARRWKQVLIAHFTCKLGSGSTY